MIPVSKVQHASITVGAYTLNNKYTIWQVQIAPGSGCGAPSSTNLPGDATTLTISSLTPNCPYTFATRAANSLGYGPFSDSSSQTALGVASAPVGLEAVAVNP